MEKCTKQQNQVINKKNFSCYDKRNHVFSLWIYPENIQRRRKNQMLKQFIKESVIFKRSGTKFFFRLFLVVIYSIIMMGIEMNVSADTSGIQVNIKIEGKLVTVSGQVSGTDNSSIITMMILKPGQNSLEVSDVKNAAQYVTQADLANDHSFAFKIMMNDMDNTGIYTIKLFVNGLTSIYTNTYEYFSAEGRLQAVEALNRPDLTIDTVLTLLSPDDNDQVGYSKIYKAMGLLIDDYLKLNNENKIKMAQYLIQESQRGTIDTESGLKTTFNNEVAILSLSLVQDIQTFNGYISHFGEILNLKDDDRNRFNDLESKGYSDKIYTMFTDSMVNSPINRIDDFSKHFSECLLMIELNTTTSRDTRKSIIRDNISVLQLPLYDKFLNMDSLSQANVLDLLEPAASISELQDMFKTAVNTILEKIDKRTSGTDNGGSGQRSVYKSSGGGTYVPLENSNNQENENETRKLFNDIDGVEWAKASIEALALKGIVTGPEDKLFRPDDNVTREQFVKMLIAGFDLTDEKAQCAFNDVPADSWYYRYIASAQRLGIVKGLEDGNFGAGKEITRQEMAVIAYRVVQMLNIDFTKKNQSVIFADSDQIASYAADGIDSMQQAGVINGIGENMFGPNELTTRAQAAVLIYNILSVANRI